MTDPKPRRDPEHCAAGHDLRVCGVYIDPQGYQKCRKCRSSWVNKHQKMKRARGLWTNRRLPKSAGDG